MLRDLRIGARMLVRSPGFTIASALTLALGIGATSAMYSVVDALLVHPVTYRDPGTLAVVQERNPEGRVGNVAPANYFDWRVRSRAFSELAAWQSTNMVLTGERPEQINAAGVTANFFHVLGVTPQKGRVFLPDEDGIDTPGNFSHVAVISDRMWRESLGSDPNVLGRTLTLNNVDYAVIGVMPASFRFRRTTQVWIPAAISRTNRTFHNFTAIGRLIRPMDSAVKEMTSISATLAAENPKSNTGWRADVMPILDFVVNPDLKSRLLLIFAAVGLTLLIACSNVASLMLARSSARGREIAIRLALGARRYQLAMQLLTESLMLSLLGGAVGMVLCYWLIEAAPAVLPPTAIPTGTQILLNQDVVLFALGVSLLTGFLFGLAPALAAPPDVQEVLKDATRGSTGGRSRQVFRRTMAAVQIAVALMLVATAGLAMQSLQKLAAVNLGFVPSNVVSWSLFLPATKFNADQAYQLHRQALDRVAALPGIESAAVGSYLPLSKRLMGIPFDLETAPPKSPEERPEAVYLGVTPDYFKTLGIPLKRGRGFDEADTLDSPAVCVVSESLVKRYFPNQDPIGQRVILNRPVLGTADFSDDVHAEIVGVVADVKVVDLNMAPPPMVYAPHAQNMWSDTNYFAIRTSVPPKLLAQAVRREMMDIDRETPIETLAPMTQTLDAEFAQPRFQLQMMGAFAALALILAAIGIYSVLAYVTAQRRPEIGLRMALGATPSRMLLSTLGEGLRLAAIGVAVGLAGAFWISSAMRAMLVGVGAMDLVSAAEAAGVLTLVALLACLIPAIRAARVDPGIALRP